MFTGSQPEEKHTSIAVHESSSSIASRDRDALTNAVDKQYTSLEDFRAQGELFIARQIAWFLTLIMTLTTTELLNTIQHIVVNNVLETYKL